MSNALTVTRRVTQAVLGAGALGVLALAGHLALSHAAESTAGNQASTSASPVVPDAGSGSVPGQVQPGGRGQRGSGFGQAPDVQGGSSGSAGGSTTTHGS